MKWIILVLVSVFLNFAAYAGPKTRKPAESDPDHTKIVFEDHAVGITIDPPGSLRPFTCEVVVTSKGPVSKRVVIYAATATEAVTALEGGYLASNQGKLSSIECSSP